MVDRAMLSGRDVRDILAAVNAWRRPVFPIGGADALAAGLKGPQVGQALGWAWKRLSRGSPYSAAHAPQKAKPDIVVLARS